MEISEAIARLREAGVGVTPTGPDGLRTDDGTDLLVRAYAKAPTRRTVEHDLARAGDRMLLYVLNATPRNIGRLTGDSRIAIVTPQIVWFGTDLTPSAAVAEVRSSRGPRPYTRFAVARASLAPDRLSQTELATRLDVSQPAVSNAVGSLTRALGTDPRSNDRGALFDYAVTMYPGTGGITTYWWRDDSLDAQASAILEADADALLSGDLAARRISGWRVPEHATLYAAKSVNPARLGFAAARPDDYTLSVTVPADTTLWATSTLHGRPNIADPVIVVRDILNTGTTGDHDEAADMVRAATLRLLGDER